MEQRRLIIFFISAMAILFVWTNYLAPIFFPLPPQPPAQQVAQQEDEEEGDDAQVPEVKPDDKPPGEAEKSEGDTENVKPLVAEQPDNKEKKPDAEDLEPPVEETKLFVEDWDPEKIKHQTITLGSLDETTGYFMEIDLTSKGAGVLELRLSDPRYVHLDDKNQPLELIQSSNKLPPTLGTVFYNKEPKAVDQEQKAVGIADQAGLIEWQVANDDNQQPMITEDPNHAGILKSVTFRGVFPDLGVEVLKTFTLTPSDKHEDDLKEARQTDAAGYQLELDVTIRNLTAKPQDVLYHLQGPVGVPIEGQENSRTFKPRQIAVGFLDAEGSVNDEVLRADTLIEKIDEERPEQWSGALRYVGVDVQYFASLLVPVQNQNEDQTYASVIPMIVERDNDSKFSDVSVVLKTRNFSLLPAGEKFPDGQPGDVVSHQIKLYAGPKRRALLDEMDAGSLLSYGRFGIAAGGMLWILNWLHRWSIPYGIAIIILTLMVRSCLYPLSRKQAIGAKKMKELQPKLNEIKKKYAKDKEKQAKAQMELFRKHNYNPLAGCLPLLLQFPIFISLYTALGISVDLRLASFLWIDNLAAPDHLFTLPFSLPFLGQQFNLLPILTIFLFIAQQRLFMPPAQTPEQEMQFKMMNVMMIVMGFMFYKVPAGLCIYFITSSLWGMAERKILDVGKAPQTQPEPENKTKVKA